MSAEPVTFFVTFSSDDRDPQIFWTEGAELVKEVRRECDLCNRSCVDIYDKNCGDRGDPVFSHVLGTLKSINNDEWAALRRGRKMLRVTGTIELVDIPERLND